MYLLAQKFQYWVSLIFTKISVLALKYQSLVDHIECKLFKTLPGGGLKNFCETFGLAFSVTALLLLLFAFTVLKDLVSASSISKCLLQCVTGRQFLKHLNETNRIT